MPVRAVCPECGATTSIDDPTSSPTLTCHQCGGTVTIPTTTRAGPPPLPKAGPPALPAPAPAAAGGFEVLEDSADSAVAVAEPPRARKPARKAAPPPDEEEYEVLQDVGDDEPEADDEDDVVEVRAAADDEDDDEVEMDVGVPRMRAFVGNFEPGDRPLPKRKAKGSGSGLKVVGLVLVALLLVGGGAAGVFFLWPDKDEGSPVVVENNPPGPENPPPQPPPQPPQPSEPLPAIDTIKFPGRATAVCTDDHQTRLFVHCPAEKKLIVYSMDNRRPVLEIDTTGPDTVFAVSRQRLIVIDPTARVIRRWVLEGRLASEPDVPVPFPGTVKAVSVGVASDGPALVVTDQPADAWPVHFLDLNTFGPADVAWGAQPPQAFPREMTVRAAADGSAWAVVPKGQSPFPGIGIRLEGKRLSHTLPFKAAPGFAIPSATGEAVFSQFGRTPLATTPKDAPKADPDATRVNVPGTPLEQVVRRAGPRAHLSVFVPGHSDPMIADLNIPAPDPGLPADESVHYISGRGLFAVVPAGSTDRIELFNAPHLHNALRAMSKPVTTFISLPPRSYAAGSTFSYRPHPVSTSPGPSPDLTLLAGPPGAEITPERVLTWQVPQPVELDRVEFRIQATSKDGVVAVQSFTAFNAGAPAPKPVGPKVTPKKTPETKPKESPKPKEPVVVAPPPDPIAKGAKLANPLPERTPITAPTLTDPFPVTLGGPVRDICVGGGGRYLIAHVPTIRRLVIFDVSAVKVAGTIGLGADSILFAAGMSKLLVVYPDEKQVLRYSLPDGKLELDAELDVRPKPVAAAMGSATAGPLVLGGPVTQNNASKLALTFIDVETLKEVRIDKAEGDLRIGFGSAVNLRISADGQTVATWYRHLQPSGIQLVRLAGNTLTGVHKAVAAGHVIPAPTGPQVFTEKGMYNAKGEPVGRREVSLPATHGTDFLTITDAANGAKTVAVWRGGDRPANEFTTLPGFDGKKDPFERDNPALALDERLFLVPDANVLVVVPPVGDRFVLYPLAPAKK